MGTIYNSDNFDLSDWNISIPIDSSGGTGLTAGTAISVSPLNLSSPYFYANSDGSMTFMAPVTGATTENSAGPRSELRELNPDGTLAAWNLVQGGTMTATLAVNSLPILLNGAQGKVMVGQIHGNSGELFRLYDDAGKIYFITNNPASQYTSSTFQLADAAGNHPTIGLNQQFSYYVNAQGSTLTVKVYIGSDVYTSVTAINPDWQSEKLYFKAGVYDGDSGFAGTDLKQGTGYGQTTFYGLDMSHMPGQGIGGLTPNAPVAQADNFTGQENNVIAGNLFSDNGHGADSAPAGDSLRIVAGTITTAHGGTVVENANGSFTYTPAAGFTGTDSFTYTLKDGTGQTSTATATFSVCAPLQPPVAHADSFIGQQNQPVTGNLMADNGHGAATDPNGLVLGVTAATVTSAHGGIVVENADGTFTYTPAAGFTGSDSFTYTLSDSAGQTATATDCVTVYAPPVAQPDNFTGQQNQPITGNVMTNDTDPNGLALNVTAATITSAHGGIVVENADGTFTYTPAAGFSGADSFTYTLNDSAGLTATGTASITVNAPPVAQPDSFTGQQNQPITGNVMTNDTDPNGLALNVTAATVTSAHGGTVVENADGTFTYTPAANFSGADSFTYTLQDSAGLSTTGTANVTVNAVITAPPPVTTGTAVDGTAGNDTLNADHKIGSTINGAGGNDYIIGHDGADVLSGGDGNDSIYGYWGNDTLAGGTGSDTLTGGPGADMFVFNAADLGTGVDKIADFSISQGDKIDISSMLQGHYTGVAALSNFVEITTSGSNSILSVDLDGTGQHWTQVATITGVTGLDVQQLVGNGTLVMPAPLSPPVAQTDSFTGQQDQPVTGNLMADNGNGADSDPNGLALDVTAATVTSAHGATVVENADGTFTYTAATGFSGTDSFSYTLHDSAGLTSTGTANVILTATTISSGTATVTPVTSLTVEGTAGNDKLNADHEIGTTVNGYGGNDYISGHDGNDVLNGGDGNDSIYGYYGNDTLAGGTGSDTLTGGPGADMFLFKAADAGTGVDKIADFSVSAGDRIDISDILGGHYNAATDVLANFVQITTSGSSSTLSVDTTGTGGAHGWTTVATISGITGLDENALVHNGNLIV